MKRRAEQIEVSISERDDTVFVTQEDGSDNGANIAITYEQIPQLVGWLREAEAEIDERRRSAALEPRE